AITCAGNVAGSKVGGAPSAALGKATCRYRTPKGAKGKRLTGAIAFTASKTKVTKRFSVKLR
ncbi:MAG: hypothetical protein WAQ33_09755, partial [Gaiellaceae bacterium]